MTVVKCQSTWVALWYCSSWNSSLSALRYSIVNPFFLILILNESHSLLSLLINTWTTVRLPTCRIYISDQSVPLSCGCRRTKRTCRRSTLSFPRRSSVALLLRSSALCLGRRDRWSSVWCFRLHLLCTGDGLLAFADQQWSAKYGHSLEQSSMYMLKIPWQWMTSSSRTFVTIPPVLGEIMCRISGISWAYAFKWWISGAYFFKWWASQICSDNFPDFLQMRDTKCLLVQSKTLLWPPNCDTSNPVNSVLFV